MNTTYDYDGADRLTSVHHDGPSGALAHYDYTLDANGNRTSMTTAAGTESYTLDALNRLTSVSYPNGDATSYTYDAAGNRLTQTVNGTTTTYSYNSAGRLTSAGGKAVTYDAAGNVTSIGADTYSWDWAGRLASSNVGGISSSYTYDGDGVRVGQTIAASTTNYLWDRAGSLPLLVDDGSQGYVQTDQGLLEQLGSTATYPLADALGSVRNLATPSASVPSSTSYDVFGSVRSQSGQQSIFGFTGQQTDSTTSLSFLRARYYDPTLGNFLSPDAVQPNAPGTQGYDVYSYVANNPATAVDPSGHDTAGYILPRLTSGAVLAFGLRGLVWVLRERLAQLLAFVGAAVVGYLSATALSAVLRRPWASSLDLPKISAKAAAAIAAAAGAAAAAAVAAASLSSICPISGQPDPAFRIEGSPVFCVYLHRTPVIYLNDFTAILKGKPFKLRYEPSKAARIDNRNKALAGQASCKTLFGPSWSLDEYPFASSKEGGRGAQVLCAPDTEQLDQSIDLNNFYRLELDYQSYPPFYVFPVPW